MNLTKRVQSMHDFFNEHIDDYDDKHAPLMKSKEDMIAALPDGVCRVLDLGAGTGLELFSLFERFPNAQVTAIDVSDLMLEKLKGRPFGHLVDCRLGDFFVLPFGECYDAVISTSALHHFTPEDKKRLYAKIYACLKNGGVFINSDYYSETLSLQQACFLELEENPHNRSHIDTPLTKEVERELMEAVGFEDVAFLPTEPERNALQIGYKPL